MQTQSSPTSLLELQSPQSRLWMLGCSAYARVLTHHYISKAVKIGFVAAGLNLLPWFHSSLKDNKSIFAESLHCCGTCWIYLHPDPEPNHNLPEKSPNVH